MPYAHKDAKEMPRNAHDVGVVFAFDWLPHLLPPRPLGIYSPFSHKTLSNLLLSKTCHLQAHLVYHLQRSDDGTL